MFVACIVLKKKLLFQIVGDESTQKDLPAPSFQPSTVLADGNVSVEEFIVFLMKEVVYST